MTTCLRHIVGMHGRGNGGDGTEYFTVSYYMYCYVRKCYHWYLLIITDNGYVTAPSFISANWADFYVVFLYCKTAVVLASIRFYLTLCCSKIGRI